LAIVLLSTSSIAAKDIVVSIAQLPVVSESRTKGVFVELVKALNREYKDGSISFSLYPFKRSLRNVQKGRADFHLPFMKSKKGERVLAEMGLEYAFERSNRVPFALYFNTSNTPIVDRVRKGFTLKDIANFRIETDGAHVIFFDDIPIQYSTCIECSVKKLDRGRIDGFIFAAREVDHVVNTLALDNIDSALIHNFDAAPVFRSTAEGKETNRIISKLIKKLRSTGELAKIMLPYTDYYRKRFNVDAL